MNAVSAELAALEARVSAPRDPIAWHNFAASEGDAGHARNAELAARRAIALGLAAPETRLVLARALLAQGRLDEAERGFQEAITLRPEYPEAHRDLAQLLWMRDGDLHAALAPLEHALKAHPSDPGLHLVRSIVLEFAADPAHALAAALEGLAKAPRGDLIRQCAHLHAQCGAPAKGLSLARQAMAAGVKDAAVTLCETLLAAGEASEAEVVAARLAAAQPGNQHALAMLATAWRILGDPRYGTLYDYESFVRTARLKLPTGGNAAASIDSIARDVEGLHMVRHHPLQQSVRGGSQLPLDPSHFARAQVQALFGAIESAVDAYLRSLGHASDPFRARNTGRFVIAGAWSVRLASGGHHTDHVHQRGWLSSACYLRVPATIGSEPPDRSGWLRLGRPGVRTLPALEAERFIRPEPGLLVLFPAYMWHGVEPFESETPRLSVAFDVVPR
jgi:uncharacterized protein (TIGR02466 family)